MSFKNLVARGAKNLAAVEKSRTPLETNSVMAAVELWTKSAAGKWEQRTDAVRVYPLPLFNQFKAETIQALAGMRPCVLKLWILSDDRTTWIVEVHNLP